MVDSPNACVSISEIAAAFQVPRHRIDYLIRSKRIPAAGRVGLVRVYDRDTVEQLANGIATPASPSHSPQ